MPELEAAAYDFVQFYREGSEMHERGGFDIAVLVESMVFTADKMALLNIPAGGLASASSTTMFGRRSRTALTRCSPSKGRPSETRLNRR